MEKKTPPKGELEGSPRKAKVPRLDLPALAAAASAPEASNLVEEGAEGISGNNRCNHGLTDSARTRLSLSLLSKNDAGKCLGCRLEDAKGPRYRKQRPLESSILMCLECGLHLCCGVGGIEYPFGHSRAHAMKERHWVAALYDDAEKGYCFNCNAEVGMPAEFEVDGYVIGIDVIRDVVSWLQKHVLLSGVMGQRPRLEVVEMTGQIQAEGRASGFGVVPGPTSGLPNVRDRRHSHEFVSANTQGYAIKGIPNIANTCYMNAILQCLLALDKLRARLLEPDDKGLCALALKELFEETASAAGGWLNPQKILTCVCMQNRDFIGGRMHDSHELLTSLCTGLNEEEMTIKNFEGETTARTVISSIFEFEVSQIVSCKCGTKSVTHNFLEGLGLPMPSVGHPTKIVASPQTSRSLKAQQMNIDGQLFPAHKQSNLDEMKAVAESGDSHLLGSELEDVILEETPKPLKVDFTEAQHICQSKDAVHSPLQTRENKVSDFELPQRIIEVPVKSVGFLPHNVSDVEVEEMNEMTTYSMGSIEDSLLLFHETLICWRCDNCVKERERASANQRKNGEQMVGSTDEDPKVVGGQTEQSDRTACSKEQGDNAGDGIQTTLFNTLPPVLTLQLKRGFTCFEVSHKICDHVRFKEYLDVGRFMDPSSVDKGNTLYRLASVVEHRGSESMVTGHYVAYVRARKLGNQQQQSSCSSAWFCADDKYISQVTLEDVLKREAYILFYERVEG